ncbi:lipopolysaccharide biosynthesis protein RfbH [bacterium]|nr:lipopolysaccharide biosynthesis protein RfbH [bacterium]
MSSEKLRQEILALVKEYYKQEWPEKEFKPGATPLEYAGRVFDEHELVNLVDSSLDFWLTTGRYANEFEQKFAAYLGRRYALLTNSGSSANLLAVSALTSPKLKDRQLVPGDEVITVACGFPTTVNPIYQNNLVPVFVDVDLATYNANVAQVEAAISPRTKAIFLAHTLGNPFDLEAIKALCQTHQLFLLEDNCDALGSKYDNKLTGTFGDLSTFSYYPAHHITMGEGGCVSADSPVLKVVVESFRDWGRDCYCAPGVANTCGKRFEWQLGSLPEGYDHKYIYSHIGYNLKLTDMQASVGLAQLDKLPTFIEARKRNWNFLRNGLAHLEDYFILPEPTKNSDPSWFAFVLTVRDGKQIKRKDLANFLESKKIATRHVFGGNLIRQPAYQDKNMKVIGDLSNTDKVMKDSIVLGVYPGLDERRIEYMIETISDFIKS